MNDRTRREGAACFSTTQNQTWARRSTTYKNGIIMPLFRGNCHRPMLMPGRGVFEEVVPRGFNLINADQIRTGNGIPYGLDSTVVILRRNKVNARPVIELGEDGIQVGNRCQGVVMVDLRRRGTMRLS